MLQLGGMGQPIMYALLGLGIGFLAQLVWQVPMSFLPLLGGNNNAGQEVIFQLIGNVIGGAIGVVIGATIGLMISAGITHVCLMIFKGANMPYETTFRVMGYANGSTAWLNIVPFVGPLVAAIYTLVLSVIGLREAHETTTGKAIGAVLLPIAVCCGIAVVFFAIMIGVIGAAAASA